jgi:ligand-binding sensor domain-containing protein/signal transduction histidine kinase
VVFSIRASQQAAVAAVVASVVCVPPARAEDPPSYALTAWASQEGLPPGDVFAIAQDRAGYLWLGTPTGLIRFDGFRFTPWEAPDHQVALPAAPIHALVGAADGSLWIGYAGDGGVVRLRQDHVTHYTPADGAPPGVNAMIQDREGVLWAATRRGLFQFAREQWKAMDRASGHPGGESYSVYEDAAGALWVSTAAGVYRGRGGVFELVDPAAARVQSMVDDLAGDLWVTHAERVVETLVSHRSPDPSFAVRLPADGWRLLRDSRGQIWVAAFGSGLLRFDAARPDAKLERLLYEHRLRGSPRALFEDRDRNIWVGMRGGLLRLTESSFTSAGPFGLSYDGVRTAAVARDGSVWVATAHTVTHFQGRAHRAYDIPQTLALHVDHADRLWVSTTQGVGTLEDGRVDPVPLPEAVSSSLVMGMTTDASGVLWLCSALKGVMAWDGRVLQAFDDELEDLGRACNAVYTDRRGRVWVGLSAGGVGFFGPDGFRMLGPPDGLTPGTILAIVEDRTGGIWISTPGGLNRYQSGRLVTITREHAPLVDLVPVLVEDEEGFLWVGVNSGAAIVRFHPGEADKLAANPSHQVQYLLYNESDGMQRGSQAWQAGVGGVRSGTGRLWVATGLGMVIIDPRNLPRPPRPAPPRIDVAIAGGQPVAATPDRVLPAGTSTLRIQYGAVELTSASKLRFRYMLEGVDDDWQYAGSLREASYTGLEPGEYRFRVGTTSDGLWTDGAPWGFAIAPPFFRTPAFLALTLLAVTLLLVMAWWMRMRAVRDQYALVLAERTRVSREIHDTLLQSLAAIGIELETIATELEPHQNPAREALRRLRRQVGHSVREARDSILELRQHAMVRRALEDSLRDLAAATTSRGVPTELVVTGRAPVCTADADFQLFRIAQEAVNNAVRHGRPSHIRIDLAWEAGRIVLTITDDGRGFHPDEQLATSGEQLGLLAMRERAERLRGRLTVRSAPGVGTTVEATVLLMHAR